MLCSFDRAHPSSDVQIVPSFNMLQLNVVGGVPILIAASRLEWVQLSNSDTFPVKCI
jgi:hypothetical protein